MAEIAIHRVFRVTLKPAYKITDGWARDIVVESRGVTTVEETTIVLFADDGAMLGVKREE